MMITVEAAMADFLMALEVDGRSTATIKWYKSLLGAFARRFLTLPLDTITPPMIRQYIIELQRRENRYVDARQRPMAEGGVSVETIRANIRSLHGFWSWCSTEYRLSFNPMTNIKRPKRLIPHPKAIDPKDVAALMDATGNDIIGIRDRAVIAFLWDTGCRAQTIMKLDIDHLNLKARRAIVEEKGRPPRSVPFVQPTAEFLEDWLAVRPVLAKTVFCSLAKRSYGRPMTSTSLHKMLKRLKKKAGVIGPVNPQAFRHGSARESTTNGANLVTTSKRLGHSTVETTASYYAVFSEDELSAMHDKYSPMKNLKFSKPPDDNEPK